MEIRATFTYDAAPTDDQVDALLGELRRLMELQGPVLSTHTAAGTFDVTFGYMAPDLFSLRMMHVVDIAVAIEAVGLGELRPIAVSFVDARHPYAEAL